MIRCSSVVQFESIKIEPEVWNIGLGSASTTLFQCRVGSGHFEMAEIMVGSGRVESAFWSGRCGYPPNPWEKSDIQGFGESNSKCSRNVLKLLKNRRWSVFLTNENDEKASKSKDGGYETFDFINVLNSEWFGASDIKI